LTGGTAYPDLPLRSVIGCPYEKIYRNFMKLHNPGFWDAQIRDSLIDIPFQKELWIEE
jgi:hypothetical protein